VHKIRDVADLVLCFFAKKMGELEQDKFSFSPFFIHITEFKWHYQLSILHYQVLSVLLIVNYFESSN
jgi:hypothetical protein